MRAGKTMHGNALKSPYITVMRLKLQLFRIYAHSTTREQNIHVISPKEMHTHTHTIYTLRIEFLADEQSMNGERATSSTNQRIKCIFIHRQLSITTRTWHQNDQMHACVQRNISIGITMSCILDFRSQFHILSLIQSSNWKRSREKNERVCERRKKALHHAIYDCAYCAGWLTGLLDAALCCLANTELELERERKRE